MNLHLTVHQSGKLMNITSINTSSLINEFCNKMGCREFCRKDRKRKTICEYCYAEKNEKLRKQLEKCLINNTKMLTEKILTDDEIPFLNNAFVRFHSFGELINDIHMHNFYNIAKKNEQTKFCLMTKRPELVVKYPKLKNVVYILSSPIINKKTDSEYLDYFDKTFTVYTEEYIKENKIKINCHGLSCINCQKCYKRSGTQEIKELLRK